MNIVEQIKVLDIERNEYLKNPSDSDQRLWIPDLQALVARHEALLEAAKGVLARVRVDAAASWDDPEIKDLTLATAACLDAECEKDVL